MMGEFALNGRGTSGLEGVWGMPRTLNAGDAFFALAHASILGLEAAPDLAALDVFDTACRAASAALAAGRPAGPALVLPALALAAEVSGAAPSAATALRRLGESIEAGSVAAIEELEIPALGRERLRAAAQRLGKGGGS
jgi:hypothetical protein